MASFSLPNSNSSSIPNASLPFPKLAPALASSDRAPGAPSPTPPPRHDPTPQQPRQGYATAMLDPCSLAPKFNTTPPPKLNNNPPPSKTPY